MLYRFAKLIMWPTLHFFFRRIHVSGSRRLPKGVPLILIANHSASFLDAMLIAVETDRPVHFYARGDVFKKRWAAAMLAQLHMIPIFSSDHGKGNLVRNRDSFDEGERVLRRKGLLLIFPEGVSRMERVRLPLKKGTARVALQTEAQAGFKAGLQVIPVGVNYSEHRFRADVLLCYGEPTSIDIYGALYAEEPAKAVNRLTTELQSRFGPTVLAVDQPERSELLGLLIRMIRNDTLEGRRYKQGQYQREKQLCDTVSSWEDAVAADRINDGEEYQQLLRRHDLPDRVVPDTRPRGWLSIILLFLGFPIALAGALICYPPARFAQWMADKMVTREDFYTSVASGVGGFGFFLWWCLLYLLGWIFGNAWFRLLILLSPLLSFAAIYWWEGWKLLMAKRRWEKLKKENAAVAEHIAALRAKLKVW